MAGTVPLWMLGKHVTSVVAQIQTINPATGSLGNASGTGDTANLVISTGTIAGGDSVITTGLIDGVEYNGQKTVENISAVTDTHANAVPIAFRDGLTLTEILRIGASSSLLAPLWKGGSAASNASRIVFVTFERGGKKWSGSFLMTEYSESIRRGKCVARMSVEMVDPGTANAAYDAGSH